MSLARKAAKEGSWLALFNFVSQIFSWVITFQVANLLVPEDYGLMEMATLITVYGEKFSELGLGAAIIHRSAPTQKELSSVFWFSLAVSMIFAVGCFFASYFTAFIFDEPRIIPITQLASVIFVVNGLQIVPYNLLQKELSFKKSGGVELITTFISCVAMFLLAKLEYGVWTLVLGRIISGIIKLFLLFVMHPWRPSFSFQYQETLSYFRYGANVALSRTVYYVYEKSDNFIIGKSFAPNLLGFYTFSKQLARIPTDRIGSLIRQVSFPLLAAVNKDKAKFRQIYLKIVAVVATITFPIYVGGFLVGEDIVHLLLDKKWDPIIPLFRFLCLAEILTSITSINNLVYLAMGRPNSSLIYSIVRAVLMAISFYIAAQFGFMAILIPWFTSNLLLCLSWIFLTLKDTEILINDYIKSLFGPIIATLSMSGVVIICSNFIEFYFLNKHVILMVLLAKLFFGGIAYLTTLWFVDKSTFMIVKSTIRKK